jgi:hypothetical protein
MWAYGTRERFFGRTLSNWYRTREFVLPVDALVERWSALLCDLKGVRDG